MAEMEIHQGSCYLVMHKLSKPQNNDWDTRNTMLNPKNEITDHLHTLFHRSKIPTRRGRSIISLRSLGSMIMSLARSAELIPFFLALSLSCLSGIALPLSCRALAVFSSISFFSTLKLSSCIGPPSACSLEIVARRCDDFEGVRDLGALAWTIRLLSLLIALLRPLTFSGAGFGSGPSCHFHSGSQDRRNGTTALVFFFASVLLALYSFGLIAIFVPEEILDPKSRGSAKNIM